MINFDNVTIENVIELNPNQPQITFHPYRTLIKYSYEAKYKLLINKHKSVGLNKAL